MVARDMWLRVLQTQPEHSFDWPSLKQSVDYPHDSHHLKICRVIINRISPTSVTNEEEENTLVKVFTVGQVEAFLLVVNSWTSISTPCWKRDFLKRVVTSWIYEENHLHDLLLNSSDGTPQANQLAKALTSLPDLVANCYRLSLPKQFTNDAYYSRLCAVMTCVCATIKKQLSCGANASTGVLSNLVGRIAFLGHSHQLWSHFLKPMSAQSSNNLITRRVVLSIMDRQQDIYLEPLLTMILSNCDDSSQVDCLLSDAINRSDKVQYLLTEKFVLISYTYSHRLPSNLIGYLRKHSLTSLLHVADTCLDIWARKQSIENRTMQQILYIYSLIIYAFEAIPEKVIHERKEDWFQVIQRAFQVHLGQTTTEIRNCGLYIGKHLLRKIKPHEEPPDMPIEKDTHVSFLEKCLTKQSEVDGAINHDLIAKMSKDTPLIEELNAPATDKQDNGDTDDLELPVRKPKYLNDAIEGLGDTDDYQWALECLKCCRELILANAMSAKESAAYIAQRLIELNHELITDESIQSRIDALVALCTVAPQETSAYLIDRFYKSDLTMATKLDILRVLGSAAVEIAFGVRSTCRADEVTHHVTVSMDTVKAIEATWNANDTSQSPALPSSSLGKSRKLTTATKAPSGKSNAFAPYAGHFFYPLITRYNGKDVLLTLDTFDAHLTSNLVFTLGILLHASRNTWESRRMARTLFPFIAPLRGHSEPSIRRAVLFAFTNILTSAPTVYLFEELIDFVQLFKSWLVEVIEGDIDQECRMAAGRCIYVLNELIDQNKAT